MLQENARVAIALSDSVGKRDYMVAFDETVFAFGTDLMYGLGSLFSSSYSGYVSMGLCMGSEGTLSTQSSLSSYMKPCRARQY